MKTLSGGVKYIILSGAIAFALFAWAFSALPVSEVSVSPLVAAVYPSGDTIRENLLRISVRFDSPPNQAFPPEVKLLREGGEQIENVFDKQLVWSADGTVLTLLLGPGRVKTGLAAHKQLGRALTEGDTVLLAVDEKIVKRWQVVEASKRQLKPNSWMFEIPPLSIQESFVITFDEPIDAMGKGYIAIFRPDGKRVNGQAFLEAGEKKWRFVPASSPWIAGDYQVLINPHLEDACGNSVSSAFESFDDENGTKPAVIRIDFQIR